MYVSGPLIISHRPLLLYRGTNHQSSSQPQHPARPATSHRTLIPPYPLAGHNRGWLRAIFAVCFWQCCFLPSLHLLLFVIEACVEGAGVRNIFIIWPGTLYRASGTPGGWGSDLCVGIYPGSSSFKSSIWYLLYLKLTVTMILCSFIV